MRGNSFREINKLGLSSASSTFVQFRWWLEFSSGKVCAPGNIVVAPSNLVLNPIDGDAGRVDARGNIVPEPPDKSLDVVKDRILLQDPKDHYESLYKCGHIVPQVRTCPTCNVRPSRRPMDDQFVWDSE